VAVIRIVRLKTHKFYEAKEREEKKSPDEHGGYLGHVKRGEGGKKRILGNSKKIFGRTGEERGGRSAKPERSKWATF